jgi:hypothetical protein
LRKVAPRAEVLPFTRKKFSINETGRFQEPVQKYLLECLYTNHSGISWSLTHTPSTSSAMRIPENTEHPDDPEPAEE